MKLFFICAKKTIVFFMIIFIIVGLFWQIGLKVYTPMTVLTGSMSPVFKPGDVIVDKRVNTKDIHIGDVITYKDKDNVLITHRVIDIVKSESTPAFKTKGDANSSEDLNLVPDNKVFGKVIFRIPLIGYVSNFIVSQIGIIVLLVLAAVLGIVYEIKTILSELNTIKHEVESTKDGMEI